MKCKKCGTEHNSRFCPNCGTPAQIQTSSKPVKKPMSSGKIAGIVLLSVLGFIVLYVAMFSLSTAMNEDAANGEGIYSNSSQTSESTNNSQTSESTSNSKVICNVGDTLNANGLKITYQKVEDWTSDNMFIVPKDGYKFIRAYFVMENTNKNDYAMGGWDFECYADNAKMDVSIYGDNMIDLYSKISSGRKLEGYIYFEVPINATEIEIEYETNWWTDKKAIFKAK